jgi:cell surface protein SprA
MRIPLSLSHSSRIERPYMKPNSDVMLSQDGFGDVFSDWWENQIAIDRQQELEDRRGSQSIRPQSRGYQTIRTQSGFGLSYQKTYQADSLWWRDLLGQVLLERPKFSFNYRKSEMLSPTLADSNYAYRTSIDYNLGTLVPSKGYVQFWPNTFELTFIEMDFNHLRRRERDMEEMNESLPTIVDYQVDLRHRLRMDWDLFPFLKINYSLDLSRDMDEYKESFGFERLLSKQDGGYLGLSRIFDFDRSDYSYQIDSVSTGEFTQDETPIEIFEKSVRARQSSLGESYGFLLNEKSRQQSFKLTMNPKLLKSLDQRISFLSQFQQDKTLGSNFDPEDYSTLKDNYWSIQRTTSFEYRPTLRLNVLLRDLKPVNAFLNKIALRTINASWSASVNSQGEEFTLPFLNQQAGVEPGHYYLYGLGLGTGTRWRNPWNIATGDILKKGPEDHTDFAEYFSQYGESKVDSLVYRKQFLNTIDRNASIGTRFNLPWHRINTSWDLSWRMQFQQPREYPLQLDTTITWPKYSIGINIPDVSKKFAWTTKHLRNLDFSHKYTFTKQRHSRPARSEEDAIDRQWDFSPLLGINTTTQKGIRITNDIGFRFERGFRYINKQNPELLDDYSIQDIWSDSITAWVYMDMVKAEAYSWQNRTTIGYDLPTNKGFRFWRWYVRLKNPIRLSFTSLIAHRNEKRFDFYHDPDTEDDRRTFILRDGTILKAPKINADPENPYQLVNRTELDFTTQANYNFTDKIQAEAQIRYAYGISRGIGAEGGDVSSQTLSYIIKVKWIF